MYNERANGQLAFFLLFCFNSKHLLKVDVMAALCYSTGLSEREARGKVLLFLHSQYSIKKDHVSANDMD